MTRCLNCRKLSLELTVIIVAHGVYIDLSFLNSSYYSRQTENKCEKDIVGTTELNR